MSRAFDATCVANVVKIEGKPVTATVISAGVKSSSGVALMTAEKIHYLTSNATDIHDLITQLSTLIQLVSDTFSAIGSGMTGPTTAPPGTLPTSITQLATIKAALNTMKDSLK